MESLYHRTVHIVFLVCLSVWLAGAVQAAPAPQPLLGRSISVTWAEEREQRALPDGDWHAVQVYRRDDIYVSTAGRIFRRESGMSYKRRGRLATGSQDTMINSGTTVFQGDDLVITTPARRGAGVRRVTIRFGQNFGSCQAVVINGIAPNEISYVRRALTNRRDYEMRSVQTSSVTCNVIDGNILQ